MTSFICFTTHQLSTSCHVSPLVRSTDLKGYIVFLVEDVEVIALHNLVGKLCVRNPCLNPFFNRFFTHHSIDRKVFSDITKEVNKANASEPIVVVDHFGFIVTIFKIEETRQLPLNGANPFLYSFFCLETTFSIFEGRISNETSRTANERIRFVAC